MTSKNTVQQGFTLTEVLIALALVGVVAAMVVPKILGSQTQSAGRAMVREAYVTVGELCLARQAEPVTAARPQIIWNGAGSNVSVEMENYLVEKLNVRRCAGGAADPCEFEFQSGVRLTRFEQVNMAGGLRRLIIRFNGGNNVGNFAMVIDPNAATADANYPVGYATRYSLATVMGDGVEAADINEGVNQMLNTQ